jgi:hypothetical protein
LLKSRTHVAAHYEICSITPYVHTSFSVSTGNSSRHKKKSTHTKGHTDRKHILKISL